MNKIRIFFSSGAHERGMVVRTLFWLWFFRLRNLVLPYRLTKKWMSEEIAIDPSAEMKNDVVIKEVASSVNRCKRYVPGATCLTQALAARAVMRHYGQASNIRLGVAKSDASIEAHAWVEVEGRIVLGRQPNNARYTVLHPPSLS